MSDCPVCCGIDGYTVHSCEMAGDNASLEPSYEDLRAEVKRLREAVEFHRDHYQIYGSDRANKDLYPALDPQGE